MSDQELCEECLLPKSICICGSSSVVYDPVQRRNEILGGLDDLEGLNALIEKAQEVDISFTVDPHSGGNNS